ncbi:MAG TPA: flavodoxin domain-containing protein [Jiangellaceae bacterium]|nr:flavodoxin domain-containing protein [Jiangellaceae bacterium]
MRARVVYESMFGNTQVVAQAVAEGLAKSMAVDLEEVGAAATDISADIDKLVVGGPTHTFGMSRERTRESAAEQAAGGIVSAGEGLREWLGALTGRSRAVAAATFDTRIDKPRMPGSAAHGAEKRLRRLGFRVLVPAASFYVTCTSGPLVDGERERARHWGEVLGSTMATADEHRASS